MCTRTDSSPSRRVRRLGVQSRTVTSKGSSVNKSRLALVAAPLAGFTGLSLAAVPAAVTTALNDVGPDSLAIATVFLIASIALAAFVFMRRGAK